MKEYRTLCCARQLGDDVFSVSCDGDPAVAYDRMMRRTLLMQRMEQVLTPRELNLARSYLGIGQPDEVAHIFASPSIFSIASFSFSFIGDSGSKHISTNFLSSGLFASTGGFASYSLPCGSSQRAKI